MARYVPTRSPANDPSVTDGFVAELPKPIKPVNTLSLDAGSRVGPPIPSFKSGYGRNLQEDQAL